MSIAVDVSAGQCEQLCVPVSLDQQIQTYDVHTQPEWKAAIDLLADELTRRAVTGGFVELLFPDRCHSWTVQRDNVPYRCVWLFNQFPSDGVPRYIGRVDVAYTKVDLRSTDRVVDTDVTK